MSTKLMDGNDAESRLATWVARLSLSEVPQAALSVARTCIADGLSVMLAGTTSDVFRRCSNLPRSSGICTVIDGSQSTDAATAALLNAVACHALDFDDTCYAGIVHGTAVVLPAVLSVSQEVNADGKQLLEAFVAGVESVYAVGLALTDSLYERGFWSTTTLGVIGAAAGAAKLLQLDAGTVAHAIRLAANLPVGLRVTHGSSGKPYLCGVAAKLGVEAAYAAKIGIHGQPSTFEGQRGSASTFNGGIFRRQALDRLGINYALLEPGIAFKLHPMCSATQAAIEATLKLRSQYGFSAADVKSVVCSGTSLVVSCLPYNLPSLPSEAQFSMTFAIACALIHGDVCLEHLDVRILTDDNLQDLMSRIKLVQDDNLVPAEDACACPEAAHVMLTLKDGSRLEHTVMAAVGMPQQPASQLRLQTKFMDCAMRGTGSIQAGELWNRTQRIDEFGSARQLFQGLGLDGRV